jgi:hypothetical protein
MATNRLARLGLMLATLLCTAAFAKLPPLSDDAKAKAAETAAKAAWGDKVAGYQLCKSQDAVAAGYYAGMKKAGKEAKPPLATPACADPGPFVYVPAPPAPAPTAALAPTAAASAPAVSAAKP